MPRPKGSKTYLLKASISYYNTYFLFMVLMMMINPPPSTHIRGISKLLSIELI